MPSREYMLLAGNPLSRVRQVAERTAGGPWQVIAVVSREHAVDVLNVLRRAYRDGREDHAEDQDRAREPGQPSEHVMPYAGPRKCLYGPEPAAFDVAGFLSCGDLDHLMRASADWGARSSQGAGEGPDPLRDTARRLLAEYRDSLEHRICGSLNDRDLWISEAADLLERIAGES